MKNVVLVTIDSLRADHCGFMGYDRDTTPTLDRMAADGIVFNNAIAPGGKTPESMPVVFTGQYPFNRADRENLDEWRNRIFPHMSARDTITEQFSEAGYRTIGFTSNSFTSRYFGFDSGFDHFQDYFDQERRPGVGMPGPIRGLIKFANRSGSFKPWTDMFDDIVTTARQSSEPYFLWVMLMDTHVPYVVPRSFRRENSLFDMLYANWRRGSEPEPSTSAHRKIVSAYDDTIRHVDAFLADLEAALGPDDPVYVVHADHGEAFGEHGKYGHSGLLYEENIRVPLVISNADGTAEYDRPVSLREMPTILGALRDGRDPSPSESLEPVLSRTESGHRFAVRGSRFKLICDGDGGTSLYDLALDPEEQTPTTDEGGISKLMFEFGEQHVRWDEEKNRISRQVQAFVDGELRA